VTKRGNHEKEWDAAMSWESAIEPMSSDVPVETCEISAREIVSCYEVDDQRCKNSIESKALREHRGSNEGTPRESAGASQGPKATICKETPESRNKLLNVSRSKGGITARRGAVGEEESLETNVGE